MLTGAETLLERALAADPDFALAHIARGRMLQLQTRMPEARAAAARARALADRLTTRERQHIEAVALSIEGAAGDAWAIVREYVAEFPRDTLPLSLALGVFGLLGFSGRRDHHEAQLALLEELAPHWGDDWWFLGYLGWAYIETGEVAKGTRLVELSLAGNLRNAHAAHQRVHGFFEAGDANGGAGFIEPCTATFPGTWRCSSWRAATPSAPARSISRISGRRWPRPRRCWCSPTRPRFCGAGGFMTWPPRSTGNGPR